MVFEYDQYFRNFLIIPLSFLLFTALVSFKMIPPMVRSLMNHPKQNIFKNKEFYKTLLFAGVLIWLLIIHISKFGRGNLLLFFEKENDAAWKNGTIEEIVDLRGSNGAYKYSYKENGESTICFGAVLVIDGEKYKIQCYGDFTVGDEVKVKFLPRSKVVLELQLIADENTE